MSTFDDFVEPEDDQQPTGEPAGRKKWPWVVGAGVLLAAGAYVGTAFLVADTIPTGTTVGSVDVGGMTEAEAANAVEEGLAEDVNTPVPVTVAGTDLSAEIDPAAAQVAIDGPASVDGLAGFSLNPADLFRHLGGSDQVEPVVTFDEQALRETITNLNSQLSTPPKDATISFVGSTIETTEAEPGTGIDIDDAKEVLGHGWLSESRPIELAATEIEPEISDEAIDKVRTEQAEPLVAGPVNVTVGEKTVNLSEADLAAAATFTPEGDTVTMTVDGAALYARVAENAADQLVEPQDAVIKIEGGQPVIEPSVTGQALDEEQTTDLILTAAQGTERDIEAVVIEAEPEITTARAEELGVTEVTAEISTPITSDPGRTQNLILGSQRVSNKVIMPGEEFSLLTMLGPITAENGFHEAGVLSNGFSAEGMGGGLSQLSTNMFNLGYRGGMEDIEHKPHSKYFPRYPMGVESTLWSPSLDMRWKNNSPYAVIVESWVDGGQLHSRLWSTQYYDVNISVSDPYNYVSPGTEENSADDCIPTGRGDSGFSVNVHRVVKADGSVVYDDSYTWTYQPWDAVRCV